MSDREAVLYRFPDRRNEIDYSAGAIKVGDRLVRGTLEFEVTAVGRDEFGNLVVMLEWHGNGAGESMLDELHDRHLEAHQTGEAVRAEARRARSEAVEMRIAAQAKRADAKRTHEVVAETQQRARRSRDAAQLECDRAEHEERDPRTD